MDWLNLHTSILDSPEVVGAEPLDRGTWLMLLRYCIGQECGGIIADCAGWKDRKWQQLAKVTLAEVRRESDLWQWVGDNLVVRFYPSDKETQVRQKRETARTNGQRGGRPKTNPEETDVGFPEEPTLASSEKAEGEGEGERKEKGIGKEGEAKSAATPPDAGLIEKIRQAYPRRTHPRETVQAIAEAMRRHAGDPEEILDGTIAIANAVAGWTENERLQFLKIPSLFFAGDHWRDDPAFWASKKAARTESAAPPRRIIPDLGGRAPSAILTLEKQ
jgi:hypothetical protein